MSKLRLVDHDSVQATFQLFGHSKFAWFPAFSVHENMNELSNCLHLFLASFEDADLVRDGALAELVDSEREVYYRWKLNWSKVITMRVHDETNLRRCRWMERAVLDEVRVDD